MIAVLTHLRSPSYFFGPPMMLMSDTPGRTSTASTPGTDRSMLIGLVVSTEKSFPARSLQVTRMWNSCASVAGGADQVCWPVLSIQSGAMAFHSPTSPGLSAFTARYSSLIGTGAMFASVAFQRMSTMAPRSPFGLTRVLINSTTGFVVSTIAWISPTVPFFGSGRLAWRWFLTTITKWYSPSRGAYEREVYRHFARGCRGVVDGGAGSGPTSSFHFCHSSFSSAHQSDAFSSPDGPTVAFTLTCTVLLFT